MSNLAMEQFIFSFLLIFEFYIPLNHSNMFISKIKRAHAISSKCLLRTGKFIRKKGLPLASFEVLQQPLVFMNGTYRKLFGEVLFECPESEGGIADVENFFSINRIISVLELVHRIFFQHLCEVAVLKTD